MKYLGIDTAAPITAQQAANLKANGVSFVGRYLVPAAYSKAISANEVKILHDAGLSILLCWEMDSAAMKNGAARGASDASRARNLANDMGVPIGTTIYFAADYNVPQSDFIQVEQYMKAAQAALGSIYNAGLYGPEKIVEFLSQRGSCQYFWQCVAWSTKFLDVSGIQQYQWQGGSEAIAMAKKSGILAVDMNRTDDMRKAGLWMSMYNEYADGDGVILEPAKPSVQPVAWYDEAMAWAKKNGLINDGRPLDNVTRAELATVLMRYDKLIDAKIANAFKQSKGVHSS